MADKEQIMIDGVNVSKCKYLPYCNDKQGNCAFEPNCYFKQLARKTHECEELKEKYEALKLENQEGYEIVAELKHECEEQKKQLETSEEWRIKAESLNEKLELRNTRYRKALEIIEGMLQAIVETNKVYPLQSNLYKILDIINKAKGERG